VGTLTRAGAKVEIVSPKAYEIQGFNHLEPGEMFAVDKRLDQAKAADYDALVIPGVCSIPTNCAPMTTPRTSRAPSLKQ